MIIGTAVGVEFHQEQEGKGSGSGEQPPRRVKGIKVEGQADAIPCDKLVLAMGYVRMCTHVGPAAVCRFTHRHYRHVRTRWVGCRFINHIPTFTQTP